MKPAPPGVDPDAYREGWERAGESCPNPECVHNTNKRREAELEELL